MNIQSGIKMPDELERLAGELARIGGIAEDMLSDAMAAVITFDVELALQVVERESQLKRLRLELEERSFSLIEEMSLDGKELRFVLACIKVSEELKRIGGLSRSIARRTSQLKDYERSDQTKSLARMGKLVSTQLKRVLDAFSASDHEAALDVWERDDEVDEFYNSIFRIMVTYMIEDARKIGACAHFMFMAKKLERVGDHCSLIAEIIYHTETGQYPTSERAKNDES
jgi:phosphate transport system protein